MSADGHLGCFHVLAIVNSVQGAFLPSEPTGKPKNTEWVAYPFSRGSSQPRIEQGSSALQADSLPVELTKKPHNSS